MRSKNICTKPTFKYHLVDPSFYRVNILFALPFENENGRTSPSWLQIQKIFNQGFLIPPNPSTNFEIQKYYQNEARFNGVYFRDNIPDKMKDGAYVINLTYFESFGVEHIPKEIKTFIGNKNIQTKIFRMQA